MGFAESHSHHCGIILKNANQRNLHYFYQPLKNTHLLYSKYRVLVTDCYNIKDFLITMAFKHSEKVKLELTFITKMHVCNYKNIFAQISSPCIVFLKQANMGMIGGPVCPKNVCPIYKHHRFEKLPLKRSVLIHHKLTELTGKIHTSSRFQIYACLS